MKEIVTDVAIISAGTAGLTAAVAAAEGGAKVVALEKSNHTGGTAIMGNGLFAVESRLQRQKQYMLTREEAFKIYMDFVRQMADTRLVKAVFDKSASTIDWLEGMGVEFWDLGAHGHGMYYTWHLVRGTPQQRITPGDTSTQNLGPGLGNASVMMQRLTERARALGVQILLKTPVKKILAKHNRITGVLAVDASGEEIQVAAKAVVITTGGYGGHFPAHGGLEGDGIRMAKEMGAYAIDREPPPAPPAGGPPPRRSIARAVASVVNSCFGQPNLTVNLIGERFADEYTLCTSLFAGNAYARQKDRTAFSIFDADTKNYYIEKGFDFIGGYGIAQMGNQVFNASGFDEELQAILAGGGPARVIAADSVEEIAANTGINLEGLKRTMVEYNTACDTGRDEAFGKQARYLRPVRTPPFYVSRTGAMIGGSVGEEGIRINYKTEVLSESFAVIPGIYAAGIDVACNIYTGVYPNIMPGIAMGFAVNSGRIAGENAAAFIKKK
jgi:fumarate reductase flavoprotein subunit